MGRAELGSGFPLLVTGDGVEPVSAAAFLSLAQSQGLSIKIKIYRHTSFHCVPFYCASQILHFLFTN